MFVLTVFYVNPSTIWAVLFFCSVLVYIHAKRVKGRKLKRVSKDLGIIFSVLTVSALLLYLIS